MKVLAVLFLLLFLRSAAGAQKWEVLIQELKSLYEKGDYEKAIEVAQQVSDAAQNEFGESHPLFASSLNNLATLSINLGYYNRAEACLLRARDLLENTLGKTHPDYAMTLNIMGGLYQETGLYDSATILFRAATDIWKKTLGEEHPLYATSLNNLASSFEKTGQYGLAEEMNFLSLAIRKKILGEEHPDVATSLNNLGLLYSGLGQSEKAASFFQQAAGIQKKILGELHPNFIASLNNLAMLYAGQEQYQKAEEFYLRCRQLYDSVSGRRHPGYASLLINLADVYERTGQPAKAEILLLDALDSLKQYFGESHPNVAGALNNLGVLYLHTGRFREAASVLQQAGEVWKSSLGGDHLYSSGNLSNQAMLHTASSQFEKAVPLIIQSGEKQLAVLRKIFLVFSQQEKENYLLKNNGFLEKSLSLQYLHPKAPPELTEANFNWQVFIKSLSLVNTREMLAHVNRSGDSTVRRLLSKWKKNRFLLAKLYTLPPVNRAQDTDSLEAESERFEKELVRLSAEFAKGQTELGINFNAIRQTLQANEVVVEFVKFRLTRQQQTDSVLYAAFLVRRDLQAPVFIPLCDENQLQQIFSKTGKTPSRIAAGLYGLKDKTGDFFPASGAEIYNLVWLPLEAYLKGVKKIFFSPAGILNHVAFRAIPNRLGGILMDNYQLHQLTSTRQLLSIKTRADSGKIEQAVLMGNPRFTPDSSWFAPSVKKKPGPGIITPALYLTAAADEERVPWKPLAGSETEVKMIRQLLDQKKISNSLLLYAAASEENLKKLSDRSPGLLHIASHGYFIPSSEKKKEANNPVYVLAKDPLLRSGLVLAGANYVWTGNTLPDGIEDGVVTAYEIAQLNLIHTKLVVLSACETALGDIRGTEGVFGLQRAFKLAGVEKMVLSLWKIPDRETVELMTAFYTSWMKGKSIEDAFMQSQAEMRKKYPPFYWAAFVLVE